MNIRDLTYNRKFLALSDGIHFPAKAAEAALKFAAGFEKSMCLLALSSEESAEYAAEADKFAEKAGELCIRICCEGSLQDVCDLSERTETPMIFCELQRKGKYSDAMTFFKAFRELRIPFVLVKEDCERIDFSKVAVPVAYLAEEKEKAPYSSNMGRFLKSEITVFQAKDYGSKTPRNVKAITEFYDKFSLKYTVEQSPYDSSKVEKQTAIAAAERGYGMVLISTSRDYGLDDLIFGPKELHIFRACKTPLMCINPRGDLYVLCW